MIDSRGYVIEPLQASCIRKQRESGDKATNNHGRPFEYFPRPSRRNKTMIDNCATIEATSREGTNEICEIRGGEGSALRPRTIRGSPWQCSSNKWPAQQKKRKEKKRKKKRAMAVPERREEGGNRNLWLGPGGP